MMDKKRLQQLAGIINEGAMVEGPEAILANILDELKRSIQSYREDPDQDAYYVVENVERIIEQFDGRF
jgi:hypothetical protein